MKPLIEDLTRCEPLRDEGYTRAAKDAPVCIHFAQGRCVMVAHSLLTSGT